MFVVSNYFCRFLRFKILNTRFIVWIKFVFINSGLKFRSTCIHMCGQ